MKIKFVLQTISFTIYTLLIGMYSCKKEPLDPPTPPGEPTPVVYITAKLNGDSVYFSGGVNSYAGQTLVKDSLTFRSFIFTLKNINHPAKSYFTISVNNYQNHSGMLQADLDSSIYTGQRAYQDAIHFIPLATTVEWVDETGTRFSSAWVDQTHHFSVLSVTNVIFENKNYKKVIVEFTCNVEDNNGHILHITNGKGTILFSGS